MNEIRCCRCRPFGWYCARHVHPGSTLCALKPRWWNIKGNWSYRHRCSFGHRWVTVSVDPVQHCAGGMEYIDECDNCGKIRRELVIEH